MLGVKQWALSKPIAIRLCHIFISHGIPIHGCDVISYREGEYYHSGDGWYTKKEPWESEEIYLNRCLSQSIQKIEFYSKLDKEYRFVLVPGLDMTDYEKLVFE